MRKIIALGTLTFLIASSFLYYAFADNVVINVTVPQSRTITSVATPLSITATLGSETTANEDVSFKTNASWTLSVKKDSTYNAGLGDLYSATANGGAGYTIPSSKFKFTSAAQGSAVQFTTSDQTVNTGNATGQAGDTETAVYRLNADFDDEAASDYSARHVYTIGP